MGKLSYQEFLERRKQGESVDQIVNASLSPGNKEDEEKSAKEKYISQFTGGNTSAGKQGTQSEQQSLYSMLTRNGAINRSTQGKTGTSPTRLPYDGSQPSATKLPYDKNSDTALQYQSAMNRSGLLTYQQEKDLKSKGANANAVAKNMKDQYALYAMLQRGGAINNMMGVSKAKTFDEEGVRELALKDATDRYQDTKQAVSSTKENKQDAKDRYYNLVNARDSIQAQADDMLADYNQRLESGESEEDLAEYYAKILAKQSKADEYAEQVSAAYDAFQNAKDEAKTASSENAEARDIFNAYGAKYGENAAKDNAKGTSFEGVYDKASGRVSTLYGSEYADILNRDDYAEKSKAGESKNTWAGKYDQTYDYINDINGQRGITKMRGLQGGGTGDLVKYDFLTDDEIGVYNYLYETEGKKAAEKYLKTLDAGLNAQFQGWSEDVTSDAANSSTAAAALFSVGTAVTAPARGIFGAAATVQDAYRTFTDEEIDPNSPLRRLSQNTQAVRGSIQENIQDGGHWYNDVGGFLYGAGMSAADSAVNALTMSGALQALGYSGDALLTLTNKLTAGAMSSEVVSMSIAESKEKGYSDIGAMSLGIIRGGIEYLTEKLGGEWAIKAIKKNPLNFLSAVSRVMIPEGVEENMGDVGNETVSVISDLVFGTNESWLRATYHAHEAAGDKNPYLSTAKDAFIHELLSFASGAVSAFGQGSVQTAQNISAIKNAAATMKVSENDVVNLMDKYNIENPRAVEMIAELTDSDSVKSFEEAMSAYENAQEIVDEAMRLSGQRNGSLLQEAGIGSVSNQVDSAWDVLTGKVSAEESQQKAQTAMKALGLTRSQQRAAEGSNKYVAAETAISKRETATVYGDAQKKLEAEGIKDERLAGAITAVALKESAQQQDATGAPEPTKLQQKLVDESPVAQKLVRELVAESTTRAAEAVVSEKDMKSVKYDGGSAEIVSVGKNGVQIRTADGTEKTVPVDRLEVSGGYGTLLDAAAGMENGNEMLRAYKPGQNVAKYISAWQSAETLIGAKTNYTMEQARQAYPALYKTLTDSQLIRAIEAGRKTKAEAEKEAIAESEKYGKLREEAEQKVKEGKAKRTEGKVKLDGIDEKKLNKQQKKVYNMVKAVAKILNFDFELYDGEKTTGGVYIQGGKIRVNINSGAYTGKYIGAATLAHEITHALQDYDKQGYAEFTDFITNEVLTPEELARLVNIQINLEPNLTPGEALDEVIANGCAKMLLNNEAIQKLAEQNRTLFGWIKDKIDEITGNINDAYDEIDLSDDLDVYKAARIFERANDEIRERWNKMLETANANKGAEKVTGKKISAEGGREQFMKIGTNAYGEEVYETAKQLQGLSYSEKLDKFVENFYEPGTPQYLGKRVKFQTKAGFSFAEIDRDTQRENTKKMNPGRLNQSDKAKINIGAAGDFVTLLDGARVDKEGAKVKGTINAAKKGVKSFDYALKNVEIDGKRFKVIINVREKANGKFVYEVKLSPIKKNSSGGSQPGATQAQPARQQPLHRSSIEKVTQNQQKSKTKKNKSSYQNQILNADYAEAVENNDMDMAARLVEQAAEIAMPNSKMRTEDGKLRKFYHGTYSKDFTEFDPNLIGTARDGDTGFFGRGFYFAYSRGEARTYGSRVIEAYLNITNPFNFQTELNSLDGETRFDYNTGRAVFVVNFAEKFPDLAKNKTIGTFDSKGNWKEISFADFAEEYRKVMDTVEFKTEELDGAYGKEWLVTADPREESFTNEAGETFRWMEYGYQQRYIDEDMANNKAINAFAYLEKTMYPGIHMPSMAGTIMETDFTEELIRRGFDGAIQSEDGDEAVAFYPEQIKSADPVTYDDAGNVIPLDERFDQGKKDIRYQRLNTEYMTEGGDTTLDYDADTDSVNIQFHRLTWEASDYVTERDKAAKEIAAKLGVTQKRAKEYIDAVNSVSKYIAENKGRLDYEDTGLSPFVGNVEYGGSFDFTTLCDKRRLYTGTFSAIQRALPNTALTAAEMLKLREMMDKAGLKVPCGKCYVEGSRASMGVYTQKFIELYKKYNPGAWAPNMAQMNTPDGIEWVRNNHSEVYEQYEYFWNHYGTLKPGDPNLFASQQKPKLYQMRSAYKGEILKHFKSDSSIEEKNRNGGVRIQSFSDFEMAHLLDSMQVIMDMSRVGLAGQAYTKIPNFAWALGRTGLKINLSIDAWDVVDGKLVFNNKEGMNFDEAMRIRDANSKNVGTICCVYDDAQLLAAMADPRIDFIIPFHRSQWKKSQYKAMGLPATTKDYTYQQNEKWLKPLEHTHEYRGRQVKDKCKNYMPNEYWDFSKSGKENAEEYLRMCARDGKRPKFYKFLTNNGDGSYSLKADGSTDGYWKLLIDFKMYDNDGNGSPQMPVQPTFNMKEVDRMLESYEGGHNTFPTAQGVVDEFVKWYKEQHPGKEQYQKLGIPETAEEQQARRDSFDNLKAENRILRARAEYWKSQTRKTKENTVRKQDTDKLANELLRKYGSKADKTEVKGAIKALGDWLVQTDELDYETLREKAEAIAEDIISGNYVLLDNSQQEQLDRLKDYLKSTPVNLTKSDFNDTGDEGFRKKYGRYFTVSENGRTIDSLWGEMAAIFGEGTFPEDVYAPGDMLNMIADYLDMWRPQYGNEFELYHGEAVDAATTDIIDAILSEDVRQTPATYADKAQQKLNAQIAKDKTRLDALREQKNARIEEIKKQAAEKNAQTRMAEKAAKYEAVSKVKQHYQDMMARQRNKRSDTAVRKKIKALHKELSDILLKPKEGRYVPKELVKATAETLSAVDTTSGRSVKAKAALAELKVKYDALAKDTKYALTYDETVSDMIQQLAENLGDGSIYDLTGENLEAVYNTLKALKHTIVTANKLVGSKIEADAFEAANQMMHETENAKGIPTKGLRKFIMAQIAPRAVFRMFGGHVKNSMWEQMYNELNNGQLTQTQILMEGGQIFRELIDDKKNMKKLHDQKNLVDIGLKDDQGNAIKVTRGMMLSVYMHLQNEQNAKHVSYGGLTVPRLAQYYKNQMKDAYTGKTGRAVAFATEIAELNRELAAAETEEERAEIREQLADLQEQTDAYMSNLRQQIEDQLTDYDRKWIAAAQQFFDVYSKQKLNEVTEMVYGFEKAQVDNYFPIHTDPDYRAASFDTIARDMSLENAGFMKERVNGANPILLEDITDVVASQLRRTAQYCGLMPAIRNFNKAYGKARAGYQMSVQSAMARTFESEGKKYVENLLADMNGARKTEANLWDELRGNMAGAVLTLNPRVALSQTASFPSAAAEIGYQPLMKALADMKNPMWDKGLQDEIAKWTPLWWYRMQGYSNTELGDIKSNEQLMSRVMDKMKWATGWIQAMDGYATGGLWQASKYYVDENFSDLEKGSEEYMMKVAETFNRVIERTQPNYTTMQRPDILRNPHAVVKQLTMFMTQRLQNTTILYDAAATYSHYLRDADAGRNGVTAADVKQAKTRLVWAVSSQLAAGATIVIFKAIADAILHNMKAYRDDDDELTTESVVKTLLTNFAETITSNILWGSEIFSWTKSAVTGERYYGVSLNGVDTLTDMLSDGNKMVQKLVKGETEDAMTPAWKLVKSVAQFFGVPLANLEKIGKAVGNHIEDAKNGTFMEADVDRTTAQNTHILFNALQAGDTQKTERVRAEFKDKKAEQSALKGYIKELYTDPDKGDKMQKQEVITMLQEYCGMTKRDATTTAQQWTMEVVTGIKYSDLKDEFLAGSVPQAKAEKYLKEYGGLTDGDAKQRVSEWLCEKETGIAYSDIGNEVKTGRLSKDKAVQMLMQYGGKSRDAATKTVNGYVTEYQYDIKPSDLEEEYLAGHVSDSQALAILEQYKYYGKDDAKTKAQDELERLKFVKAHPDAEDISITQVRNYKASGLDGYVSASDYAQAAKMMGTFKGTDLDNNGKTDSYSIAVQKLEYIDTFNLTDDQKTALAVALGINEKTVRRKAPWR